MGLARSHTVLKLNICVALGTFPVSCLSPAKACPVKRASFEIGAQILCNCARRAGLRPGQLWESLRILQLCAGSPRGLEGRTLFSSTRAPGPCAPTRAPPHVPAGLSSPRCLPSSLPCYAMPSLPCNIAAMCTPLCALPQRLAAPSLSRCLVPCLFSPRQAMPRQQICPTCAHTSLPGLFCGASQQTAMTCGLVRSTVPTSGGSYTSGPTQQRWKTHAGLL
jgi:hypothetical protein